MPPRQGTSSPGRSDMFDPDGEPIAQSPSEQADFAGIAPSHPELDLLRDLLLRTAAAGDHALLETAVRALAAGVAKSADASSAAILTLSPDAPGHLRVHAGTGRFETAFQVSLPIQAALAGTVFSTGEPARVADLTEAQSAGPAERALRIGPAYLAPVVAESRSLGVLIVGRDRGAEPFFQNEMEIVARYQHVAREILGLSGGSAPAAGNQETEAGRALMNSLRHEVNNPLAVIMGQAQMLRRDSAISDDPYLSQSLDAVLDAAERVRAVLRGLTRADEG